MSMTIQEFHCLLKEYCEKHTEEVMDCRKKCELAKYCHTAPRGLTDEIVEEAILTLTGMKRKTIIFFDDEIYAVPEGEEDTLRFVAPVGRIVRKGLEQNEGCGEPVRNSVRNDVLRTDEKMGRVAVMLAGIAGNVARRFKR